MNFIMCMKLQGNFTVAEQEQSKGALLISMQGYVGTTNSHENFLFIITEPLIMNYENIMISIGNHMLLSAIWE